MDSKIDKLLALTNELLMRTTEIQETQKKNDTDKLMERIHALEQQCKDLHIKFDCISSLEPAITINPPNAPTTVKIAGVGRPANVGEIDVKIEDDVKIELVFLAKPFHTCSDFFKHMWSTDKQTLFDREIMTQVETDKIQVDNQEKLSKAKNSIVLQKNIAALIWKTLPDKKMDIVKSIMKQYENDLNKSKSKEITLE